jgi:hypothetical protein
MKSITAILNSIPDSFMKFLQAKAAIAEPYSADDKVADFKLREIQQQLFELLNAIKVQINMEKALGLKQYSGIELEEKYKRFQKIVLANMMIDDKTSRNVMLLDALQKLLFSEAFIVLHEAAINAKQIQDNLSLSLKDSINTVLRFIEVDNQPEARVELNQLRGLQNVIGIMQTQFDDSAELKATNKDSTAMETVLKYAGNIQVQIDHLQTKLQAKNLADHKEKNLTKKLTQLSKAQVAINNYIKIPNESISISTLIESIQLVQSELAKNPHVGPVNKIFSTPSTTKKIITDFLEEMQKYQQTPRLTK